MVTQILIALIATAAAAVMGSGKRDNRCPSRAAARGQDGWPAAYQIKSPWAGVRRRYGLSRR